MATVVQHGRRQGTPKAAEQKTKAPTAIVLKREEWDRLQNSLKNDDHIAETMRIDERKRLHEASKESVAGWTNTIVGLRQQKLEAKAQREQKEEEKRIQQDIEEARFQAEKRREAIQRARALQFAQTEKAKNLQSAVLLSEVLREREHQSTFKHERAAALSALDLELHKMTLQELQAAAIQEEEARKRERMSALELAAAQIEQAALKRTQRREKRENLLQEQQEIDERTQTEFIQETAEAKEKRRQHALTMLQELEEQKREREEVARIRQQYDDEDEARRKEYTAAKERLAQLKYEKEVERIQEAERRRGVVTDDIKMIMAKREAAEAEARDRAIVEREEKLRKAEEEKQRKVEASVREIKAHQAVERARLEQARRREQELAEEERKANEKADAAFIAAEKTKAVQDRVQRKQLKEEYAQKIEEHGHAKAHEKELSAAEREAVARAVQQEEDFFRQFALQQVQRAEERGCTNVIPILRAAAPPHKPKEAPKTGAAWKRAPGNPAPGNTQLRLGFTWKE